jgi:hypothetical protein
VLELNRIRLALERSGTLALWVPETFIRVVNLSPTFCYAKVYDAMATVDLCNKVWAEFAIEDERTLKTEQKYAKIFKDSPSGVTSKPAIEGHFKTGQRTNTLDDLVLPYWLSVWQHRLMASPMPVL